MKIIDSHAHLMDEMYENDVNEVIQRCLDNNLEYIKKIEKLENENKLLKNNLFIFQNHL